MRRIPPPRVVAVIGPASGESATRPPRPDRAAGGTSRRFAGSGLANLHFDDALTQPQSAPVGLAVPTVDGVVRPSPRRPGGEVEAERRNRLQGETGFDDATH